MSSTLVFVYGTLKRGLSNHGWLRGQTFVGEARTVPRYRIFDLGGYPGMVLADEGEGGAIEGEVWAVDEEGLRGLDRLEGVAEGEYAFEQVRLEGTWEGEAVKGYLYLRPLKGCPEVKGRWVE